MSLTSKYTTLSINGFDSVLRIHIGGSLDVQDFLVLFDSIDSLYRFKLCFIELDRYLESQPNFKFDAFHEQRDSNNYAVRKRILELFDYKKDMLPFESSSSIILGFGLAIEDYFEFKIPIVARTKHASPGFTDILGIGKVLKDLKDLIMYYLPNKSDQEKAEILKQDRIKKQIENLKSIGFTDIEIRELLLQNDKKELQLDKLVTAKKITAVEDK